MFRKLSGFDPRRVLDLALAALGRASMPPLALAISSGRGLYLLWLHSPIPRAALPRWTACEHELYDERFEAPRLDQEVIG